MICIYFVKIVVVGVEIRSDRKDGRCVGVSEKNIDFST